MQAQAREDHSKESRNRQKFPPLVEEPSAIGSCFKDMALGELTIPGGRPCTKGYMGSTNFTRRMKKEKENTKLDWLRIGGGFWRSWGELNMVKTHCIELSKNQ